MERAGPSLMFARGRAGEPSGDVPGGEGLQQASLSSILLPRDSETFLAAFQLQIRQVCFRVSGLTHKPRCWLRHLGNLLHSQALLAAFRASAELAEAAGRPTPEESRGQPAKGRGVESAGPVCLLVSRLQHVGAEGTAEAVIGRDSRAVVVAQSRERSANMWRDMGRGVRPPRRSQTEAAWPSADGRRIRIATPWTLGQPASVLPRPRPITCCGLGLSGGSVTLTPL